MFGLLNLKQRMRHQPFWQSVGCTLGVLALAILALPGIRWHWLPSLLILLHLVQYPNYLPTRHSTCKDVLLFGGILAADEAFYYAMVQVL
jgi:uncharacterized membrane protein